MSNKYTVNDTSAQVTLGPVSIGKIYVLTSPETGVVAYGLPDKLADIATVLNGVLSEHEE